MRSRAKVVELPSVVKPSREEGEAQVQGVAPARPLLPSQCRAYMRRRLTAEFPGIVDGFVRAAKRGSCQHVKLATELLDAKGTQAAAPTGSKTLQRLVTKMQQLED